MIGASTINSGTVFFNMTGYSHKRKKSVAIAYGDITDIDAPLRTLYLAVINRAVHDITGPLAKDDRKFRSHAIGWILHGDRGSVTFKEACQYAELKLSEIAYIKKIAREAGL